MIFDTSAPTIEDMVKDIFKDVPDKEWDRLPPDLTDRLDYYLYGVSRPGNPPRAPTTDKTGIRQGENSMSQSMKGRDGPHRS